MDKKSFKINKKSGNNPAGGRKQSFKNAAFIALIILFGLAIFSSTNQPEKLEDAAFSDVVRRANNGELKKIEIAGSELKITKDNEEKPSQKSRKESGASIYE